MPKPSKVSITIDLGKQGKQIGALSAPHSRNDSGWGAARFPIACIKNGAGPTVFLTGGNHGDEYEGPIALTKLVRALDPAQVQGRAIVVGQERRRPECGVIHLGAGHGVDEDREAVLRP